MAAQSGHEDAHENTSDTSSSDWASSDSENSEDELDASVFLGVLACHRCVDQQTALCLTPMDYLTRRS